MIGDNSYHKDYKRIPYQQKGNYLNYKKTVTIRQLDIQDIINFTAIISTKSVTMIS